MPISEAIEIMRQVAGVLQGAYEIGLVHRDIKPDNIFVTTSNEGRLQTKVLDFGLAKDLIAQTLSLTSMGHGLGTPAFMSPEQCQGSDVDIRSDLYSLGATAYEMLTGRPPFPGPTPSSYIMQHVNNIPVSAQKLNPNVPENLSQVVDRLLAKDPNSRHETPGELLEDLNRVERGEVPLKLYKPKKPRRHSLAYTGGVIAAAILLTVMVVGGWLYLQHEKSIGEITRAETLAQQHVAVNQLDSAAEVLDVVISKYADYPDRIKSAEELRRGVHLQIQQRQRKYEDLYASGLAALSKREPEKALGAFQSACALVKTDQAKEQIEVARKAVLLLKEAEQCVAQVQTKLGARLYDDAIALAAQGTDLYANTRLADQLGILSREAQEGKARREAEQRAKFEVAWDAAAAAEARGELKEAEQQYAVAERYDHTDRASTRRKAVAQRIAQYEETVAQGDAFARNIYQLEDAIKAYEQAGGIWDRPDVKEKIVVSRKRLSTRKDRIAIVDFKEGKGVAIPDAGQAFSRLLLSNFGDRYVLVEREQLVTLLKEVDLQMTDLFS